ncbi:hypothetical protein HYV82_00510, partial [Candidatus Woesearchaeota archaeon]|nr:hypothetical protein [Candidatus Woesearchaeota archaeon]
LDSVFLEGLERSLDALLTKDVGKLQSTVLAALTIKAHIVNLDPRDVGERRILNFGHTIGQAVEAASTYELSHGEAISIGMVCEGKYCVAVGDWKQEELDRMTQLLQTIGLPTSVPQNLSVDAVVEAARHDKKRAGAVRIIAPESFGSLYYQGCRIAEVGEDELIALLSTQAPNGYIAGKWNSIRSAPRSW